jgi:hypothetical protein
MTHLPGGGATYTDGDGIKRAARDGQFPQSHPESAIS